MAMVALRASQNKTFIDIDARPHVHANRNVNRRGHRQLI